MREFKIKFLFRFLFFMISGLSLAQETSMVLPGGITRLRYVNANTSDFSQEFKNNSEKRSLVHELNRTVNQEQILQAGSQIESQAIKNELSKFNQLSSLGNIYNDLNLKPNPQSNNDFDVDNNTVNTLLGVDMSANTKFNVQTHLIAIEHGLDKNLTVGIKIPWVKIENTTGFKVQFNPQSKANIGKLINHVKSSNNINVKAAKQLVISKTPLAAKFIESLSDEEFMIRFFEPSVRPELIKNVISLANTNLQNLITNTVHKQAFLAKGYKDPNSFEVMGLSDIEVGFKYRYYNNNFFRAAVQTGLRLPTTNYKQDLTNILDPGIGDDQLDFAVAVTQDWNFKNGFKIGSFLEYTYQFADNEARYIEPDNFNDPGLVPLLENFYDDEIDRKLGDIVKAEISLGFPIYKDIITGYSAYQYKKKFSDKFSGSKDGLNYGFLSEETDSESHNFEGGIGFSTIPFVKNNRQFGVPLELRLKYNHKLGGRYTSDLNFVRADFILYF